MDCCDTEVSTAPDCATALQAAVNAYHALMVGAAPVLQVTTEGATVQYDRRNVGALKDYIAGLYQQCPCASAAAVLGIPARRRLGQMVYGPSGHFRTFGGCCR
ncbi:MAG: gpW family head-tail joining protein [Polynucleobacter sp.]